MKTIPLLFSFTICFSLFAGQDAKQVTYLGIHTDKLAPSTTHQLDLPQGIYLEVIHVGEGSPAQKAGLQAFDILRKFDDQILINQDQLKQLVRMKKPGDSVTLDLLRKGESLTIPVRLEKTLEKPKERFSRKDPFQSPQFPDNFFMDSDIFGNERIRDLFEREFRNRPRSAMPDFFNRRPKGASPSDPNNGPVHQPDADVQSFSFSSSQNQVVKTDDDGTLHYTEKDGEKFLRATNPQGELVFEGPVNTEDERKSLPKGLLKRLKALENQ